MGGDTVFDLYCASNRRHSSVKISLDILAEKLSVRLLRKIANILGRENCKSGIWIASRPWTPEEDELFSMFSGCEVFYVALYHSWYLEAYKVLP